MKVARFWTGWLLGFVLSTAYILPNAGVSFAGSHSDAPITAENEQAALQSGVELERGRRWPEAIEYYEKSLETWADSSDLKYALRRAKVQFAVERRYNDRSFNEMLLHLSQTGALSYLD